MTTKRRLTPWMIGVGIGTEEIQERRVIGGDRMLEEEVA
jgi:hypothetical protein